MFDCRRCRNTGRITEQYYEPSDYHAPIGPSVDPRELTQEIKTREVECPDCLGFSQVRLRPRR